MRFFDGTDFVQLEVADYFAEMGIVTLDVQIASRGFTGYEQAEIFLADLKSFIQDLKALEATRLGEVTLNSINPLVFQLGFTGQKNYQDFLIHGHLRALGVEIYGDFKNAISFAIRLDQSCVWGFVSEFEELVSSIK